MKTESILILFYLLILFYWVCKYILMKIDEKKQFEQMAKNLKFVHSIWSNNKFNIVVQKLEEIESYKNFLDNNYNLTKEERNFLIGDLNRYDLFTKYNISLEELYKLNAEETKKLILEKEEGEGK